MMLNHLPLVIILVAINTFIIIKIYNSRFKYIIEVGKILNSKSIIEKVKLYICD